MMVTFISQCEKKALSRTRKVLDAFADRIGTNTWQTVITQEGLLAVKKSLRKTATKNTAVSCHWIRSRSRSELVWIVGARDKFNQQGIVPVNTTHTNHLLNKHEGAWRSTDVIAISGAIAGLFHDFGKANVLFQNKLNPKKKTKNHEPYRHEWVSLRLFQAFVDNSVNDDEWLTSLSLVNDKTENKVLEKLIVDPSTPINNPLSTLPPLAQLVGWLIVSHHKLPIYPKDKPTPPSLEHIEQWLPTAFEALWNSSNCRDKWDEDIKNKNWLFTLGTPFTSLTWRVRAKELADRALRTPLLFQENWFDNRFTSHLSRLVLMLSDHYYSASDKTVKWQDPKYKAYANTDENGLKQKLDEHNIGVATNTYLLAKKLPSLRSELPHLGRDKKFSEKATIESFLWQNKAHSLAKSLSETTVSQGFFGINMASTGLGKTLANARIMVALSEDNGNCRFNVALGLRTLTLQTGDALADRLKLDDTELAVLVGSRAVKQLHQLNTDQPTQLQKQHAFYGSESLEALFPDDAHISYKGALNNGILSKWLRKSPKLEKLLNAPVLVSTIDYLMPATEGSKGGRQIAPMLRLLTSDLVLDEPDDFGLEDMPALCRLVNWAGMLGSRVLLSTATMPPALAFALFEAYQAGRKDFTAVHGDTGLTDTVCCAWFDEFSCTSQSINTHQTFNQAHSQFIDHRIKALQKNNHILRKAKVVDVDSSKLNATQAINTLSSLIHQSIHDLHRVHHQSSNKGQTVSIGLVRMANISPLVAIAKALFNTPSFDGFRIHFCIYHSQFPLAVRSHIERKLDAALTRHNKELIWEQNEIQQALNAHTEKNHIFVVLATSVAEVGRDHDYDWAIAEPSSMRSLIQLAGRIQRHRQHPPHSENLFILSKNMKALQDIQPAYCKPGFETKDRLLAENDVKETLKKGDYQHISAIPRIKKPQKIEKENGKYLDFVQLEHWALFERLLGGKGTYTNHAKHWWDTQPTWCAELQKIQPFRQSSPDATYCLYSDNEDEDCYWTRKDDTSHPVTYPPTNSITRKTLTLADGKHAWFSLETKGIYDDLANSIGANQKYISKVFGEITLRKNEQPIDWCYHENLGVYINYDNNTENLFLDEEG